MCPIALVEGEIIDVCAEQTDATRSLLLSEVVDAGPKSLAVKVEHGIKVKRAGPVVRYRRRRSKLYGGKVT